ncbi:MAG: hypothetical protein WAV40_04490 [Microgenomates group bacterium]
MKNINGNISYLLNSLLSERLVVQKTLGVADRIGDGARVLYGETYDAFGITIDSLKYYLFLEYLARIAGEKVHCTVVEGDLHSVINPSVVEKNSLMREGRRRVGQISRIFEILKIKQVSVKLMSELFSERKVMDLVSRVSTLVKDRVDMQDQLIPTVLQNRVAQERESGFRYAAEAIGLALNFDLKVGPPREENYDKIAQAIGQQFRRKYSSIYLRPSYSFTSDFSFYLTHPEIEEYGLTPYKAGSNKMQDLRIVLGGTSEEKIMELMSTCYVPRKISYANPLVDLASIVVMSEQIRRDKIDALELGKQIIILVQNRDKLTVKVVKLLREVV